VAALRLQTLAGARPELQVYVPPVSTRNRRGAPTGADLKALNDSRFVLAIISGVVPPAMQQELAIAQRGAKTIVPIVVRGRGNVAGIQADQPVFYLDPHNPVETEKQIVDYVLDRAREIESTGRVGPRFASPGNADPSQGIEPGTPL